MKILAIETSCDETAASLFEAKGKNFILHSNVVASQIDIHKKTGGIVPEVAAREHVIKILPVIKEAVEDINEVDVIAVTSGPGLVTSLIVGMETAKVLAYAFKKPLIPINHMEGHLYSNWLPVSTKELPNRFTLPEIKYPALALIISGGHTELVLLKKPLEHKKVGETLDDAAGEAFDKVAKILGFGYPGGPIIEKMAKAGNPEAFDLPRPMIGHKNLNFSFSGLKTAVLYKIKDKKNIPLQFKKDLCASFQQAAFDVLISKTLKAAKQYGAKTIMVSGGVAANRTLASQLKKEVKDIPLLIPPLKYCTDNAAMIAMATYFHAIKKDFVKIGKAKVDPNLDL